MRASTPSASPCLTTPAGHEELSQGPTAFWQVEVPANDRCATFASTYGFQANQPTSCGYNVPWAQVAAANTLFVTGASCRRLSNGQANQGITTAAFDTANDGRVRWSDTWFPAGWAGSYAIAASPSGDRVYVTGYASPSSAAHSAHRSDTAVTIAYEGATGHRKWIAQYNPAGGVNLNEAVAVSSDGSRVYVAGLRQGAACNTAGLCSAPVAYAISYLAAGGRTDWVAVTSFPQGPYRRDGVVAPVVPSEGLRLRLAAAGRDIYMGFLVPALGHGGEDLKLVSVSDDRLHHRGQARWQHAATITTMTASHERRLKLGGVALSPTNVVAALEGYPSSRSLIDSAALSRTTGAVRWHVVVPGSAVLGCFYPHPLLYSALCQPQAWLKALAIGAGGQSVFILVGVGDAGEQPTCSDTVSAMNVIALNTANGIVRWTRNYEAAFEEQLAVGLAADSQAVYAVANACAPRYLDGNAQSQNTSPPQQGELLVVAYQQATGATAWVAHYSPTWNPGSQPLVASMVTWNQNRKLLLITGTAPGAPAAIQPDSSDFATVAYTTS